MSVLERALMESELIDIVEGEFALPIILKGPDGVTYDKNLNDPTGNTPLMGNVLYDSRRETPTESGAPIVVYEMVITLRRSSLPPLFLTPGRGGNWAVFVPQDPTPNAPMVQYTLDNTKVPDDGRTVGTIRIYPKRPRQSP